MKRLIFLMLFSLLIIPMIARAEDRVVLVAYYSARGHTELMAKAVAEGASSVEGISVRMRTVDEVQKDDLLSADAIIVGSPVYNANVVPQVQKFINSWPFKDTPLKNKIGAAFTTGGGISAGEETVMLTILRSMLIYNMIVVGGPDWQSAFGASAIVEETPFDNKETENKIAEHFLAKARALGARVALLAKSMQSIKTGNGSK